MLLEGSIRRGLLLFAIPLLGSLVFQMLYNTMDTVIIGYYIGDNALAAIGGVAAIFELIVGLCTGFGQGMAIIVGQAFGSENSRKLSESVSWAAILALGFSLVFMVLGLCFLPALLEILKTPAEVFDLACSYILIIAAGLPVTMFYNYFAAGLRAVGDSVTPLVILIVSSVLNVFFDISFITVLHLSVPGTAYATVLAQLISLILTVVWVFMKRPLLIPRRQFLHRNPALIRELTEQGLAMALMSSIVSIGTVILQGAINSLGTVCMASQIAARKVCSLINMPIFAMMTAVSVFTAQNVGAGQIDRVSQGIAFSNRFGLYYGIVISLSTLFFAKQIISLISGSSNPDILSNGAFYMKTNIPFNAVLALVLNLRSSMQSMGFKTLPVISSVIELIGKVIFTWMIIPLSGYAAVCLCEPIIWCAMAAYLIWCYLNNSLMKASNVKARVY